MPRRQRTNGREAEYPRELTDEFHSFVDSLLPSPAIQAQILGLPAPADSPGPREPTAPTRRMSPHEHKPAEIGFFDPSLPDTEGFTIVNGITHYTNVYVFIDRLRKPVPLMTEE